MGCAVFGYGGYIFLFIFLVTLPLIRPVGVPLLLRRKDVYKKFVKDNVVIKKIKPGMKYQGLIFFEKDM